MCELKIHSAIYNEQDHQTQLQFSPEKASVKILALATNNELCETPALCDRVNGSDAIGTAMRSIAAVASVFLAPAVMEAAATNRHVVSGGGGPPSRRKWQIQQRCLGNIFFCPETPKPCFPQKNIRISHVSLLSILFYNFHFPYSRTLPNVR
jgi:hypothetical protein